MPAISTTIGVQAPPGSPGQAIDFEGEVVLNCTITNNSGIAVEYTVDGVTWVSVANAATATPLVGNPQVFKLRRGVSGAYPAAIGFSWVYGDDEAKFTPGGTSLIGPDGVTVPAQAREPILNGASAGIDSGWIRLSPNPERFVYQLDSGTTSTTFSVDISADGVSSLGQAFTGTYASSTVAEITPPLMFSNPLAKYLRWTVVSGGPLSVSRGA